MSWAVVRVDPLTYAAFRVERENRRHAWLETGMGLVRYTKAQANWRFVTEDEAKAVAREYVR